MIAQGAEATITREGDVIVKTRARKSYRIPVIDETLRKSRTRRETKILTTLSGFPAPKLLSVDDQEMVIRMSYIAGKSLRDCYAENIEQYSRELGTLIGRLHALDIIHGDLTTSNMIANDTLHLIDFGLSFFSAKIEDKAVDLHLLRQAIESKHSQIVDEAFPIIVHAYKEALTDAPLVLERLQIVDLRGRNKAKA